MLFENKKIRSYRRVEVPAFFLFDTVSFQNMCRGVLRS